MVINVGTPYLWKYWQEPHFVFLKRKLQLDYSGGKMGCQIELFLIGRGIFVIL